MTNYELLYIVSGAKTESEVTTVTDAVNNSLTKAGGKITDENLWGRRRLAYPIATQEHGWYVVTKFSLDGVKLSDWQISLRTQTSVVRTLVVRADEMPTEEEAARIEESLSGAERTARQKQARPPRETSSEVPEELAKTAKPAPKKAPATAVSDSSDSTPEPKSTPKEETPTEQKDRQEKLDQKLDEILKEE